MNLKEQLEATIRNIPDFPRPGVQFKDITPIFLNTVLCDQLVEAIVADFRGQNGKADAVCAVESRGFFLGILLANKLKLPFFPIRKAGKLPGQTRAFTYQLEYGAATVEVHTGIVQPGWRVMVHDDLLATGGTAAAAAELIRAEGGQVAAFSFIAELDFLNGRNKILPYSHHIFSAIHY